MQIRALVAVGDVLVAGARNAFRRMRSRRNVDRHLAELRAQRRWLYKVVLATMQLRPLLELLPPLSEIERGHAPAVPGATVQDAAALAAVHQAPTQVMIRICQQLSFVGYYGDPRSFESIGYQPFSERARVEDLDVPEPGPHPL